MIAELLPTEFYLSHILESLLQQFKNPGGLKKKVGIEDLILKGNKTVHVE